MALCTVCTDALQEQHLSRDLELLLERMESPAWDLAPQQDTYKAKHLPANKGHTAHHHQVKLFSSSCHFNVLAPVGDIFVYVGFITHGYKLAFACTSLQSNW